MDGPFSLGLNNTSDTYEHLIYVLKSNRRYFSKLQDHIQNVFGINLVFDDLSGQTRLFLRLKPNADIDANLTNEEKAFLWQIHSPTVVDQGHGLWAYLRLFYSLFNPLKKITLIDEPEHYLHSTLKRSLGSYISELSTTENKQFFITSHDSEFVRGIISNYPDAQIIHLSEKNNEKVFNVIPFTISYRSQSYQESVINSYFNKLTILCEGEDDRVIYQYAMKKYFPNESIDIHFIGLTGKPAVKVNFKELLSQGIRTLVIYDFDALISGEFNDQAVISNVTDWTYFNEVRQDLDSLGRDEKKQIKKKGFNQISDLSLKERVEKAIKQLRKYGILFIPLGELESWQDDFQNDKVIQNLINEIDEEDQKPKKVELKAFLGRIIELYKQGS